MKITKKELNSIIQEEINQSLDEVDLRNFMRKGMEKLKSPFQAIAKYKGDVQFPSEKTKSEQPPEDDFDIDEGTPVEFAAEELVKSLMKNASPELVDLLMSDPGVKFTVAIAQEMNQDKNAKYTVFEQQQEISPLFISSKVEDLVGTNVKLKKELLQHLLAWAKDNPEAIVDVTEIENELQSIQQAQPEPEPSEKEPEDVATGDAERGVMRSAPEPSEKEPEDVATTQTEVDPKLVVNNLTTPTDLIPFSVEQLPIALSQYKNDYNLRKSLVGPENVQKFVTALVKRGLLFPRPLKVQEQKKIWQDYGFKRIVDLENNRSFRVLVKMISDEIDIKPEAVSSALFSLWKYGKLARPYDVVNVAPEKEPGQVYPDPSELELMEESKRWKRIAGILKD